MRNKKGQNTGERFTLLGAIKALLKQYLFFKNFRIDAILAAWFVQVFKVSTYCLILMKWLAQERLTVYSSLLTVRQSNGKR